MTSVYDSGSDIEDTHARLRPEIFNADIKINHIIHETADHRSDNKARVVTEIYRIILHILPKSVHNPFNDYRPIFFWRNANPCILNVAGEVLPTTLSHRNIYLKFVDLKLFLFSGSRDREFSCHS